MAKRRPGLFLIWRQAGVLCLLCCGCGKLPDNVPDSTEQMGLQCFQCARVGVKNGTVAAGADEIDDQVEHDLCVRPPDTVGCDQLHQDLGERKVIIRLRPGQLPLEDAPAEIPGDEPQQILVRGQIVQHVIADKEPTDPPASAAGSAPSPGRRLLGSDGSGERSASSGYRICL